MELVDLPVVVLTTVLPGQVVKRGQVNGFFFGALVLAFREDVW